MRIKDLFEDKQMQLKDFVENNEIKYDLAEDLVFFMNHDDDTYRYHTYPAIVKCLEGIRKNKNPSYSLFKDAALESYKNYCKQYPIRELPSSLDGKIIEEVCKMIHEEVCTHESEGKYKD